VTFEFFSVNTTTGVESAHFQSQALLDNLPVDSSTPTLYGFTNPQPHSAPSVLTATALDGNSTVISSTLNVVIVKSTALDAANHQFYISGYNAQNFTPEFFSVNTTTGVASAHFSSQALLDNLQQNSSPPPTAGVTLDLVHNGEFEPPPSA